MPSDSRLKKRILGSNQPISVDTCLDSQNVEREGEELATVLKIGLAALGVGYLHKQGYLKEITKPLLELGDAIVKNGGDKAYLVTKSIEDWSFLKTLSSEAFESSWQKHNPPQESLFRTSKWSLLKNLASDTKTSIDDSFIDFRKTRKAIDDTIEDIDLLKEIISENTRIGVAKRSNYRDANLVREMEDMNSFFKDLNNLQFDGEFAIFNRAKRYAKSSSTQEFVNSRILTEEQKLAALKQNGYRPVVLDDFLEIVRGENMQTGLGLKPNAVINVMDSPNSEIDHTLHRINTFFQDPYKKYNIDTPNGLKTTSILGDWDTAKNMIFDSNIMVDEAGRVIDLRTSDEIIKSFKRSLVNNFNIPVLGFNPLASLTNWGRANKSTFAGLISGNQMDPVLTGKAGRVTVKDVFGSDVIVFNNKAFSINKDTGDLDFITDGIILNKISDSPTRGFNRQVETVRKIGNLKYNNWKDYTPEQLADMPFYKRMMIRAEQWADMGYQDKIKHKGISYAPDGSIIKDERKFADYFNIENFVEKKFFDFTNKAPKPHTGEVIGETPFNPSNVFGEFAKPIVDQKGVVKQSNRYVTTRKSITFKDVYNQETKEDSIDKFFDFLGQFTAGRDKHGNISKNFTQASIKTYGLFDAVEERLGSISPLLGLSYDSKGNLGSKLKNIILKRVIPIYAATQIPEILNAISEPIFQLFGDNEDKDGTGNKMNITKALMSSVVKPVDLGFHRVKDALGITKVAKGLEEFMPGFDQVKEFPGLNQLGITQTLKEREEYIKSGVDPVRKGRYWISGNTPYTGGKIMYFRPNLYRRVAADVDFSDSKWGSRTEYFSNAWYPNPINPLAPLNHFVLDPYHYDKKHYKDRPYMKTAPAGSNVPLIGPMVGSTVGKIIRPQIKMHHQYWDGKTPIRKDDEGPNSILTTGEYGGKPVINIYGDIISSAQVSSAVDAQARFNNTERSKKIIRSSLNDNSGIVFETRNILPQQSIGAVYDDHNPLEIYSTPSGGMQMVDIPNDLNLYEVNQQLQKYSIKKIIEADTRIEDVNNYNPELAVYNNEDINNEFIYGLGEQYNSFSQVIGMKGFELQAFVTGKANQNAKVIENSAYAYSFNKDFWDQNYGGFGGDISEIFRRFVQKRNNNTEYINTVRNTMPDWMPGNSYFTDFKHGDPYSKIDNGEERLPGEGYERLWNMGDVFNLGIGSSYIGKSKEDMTLHLLDKDKILDDFGKEVTAEGNRIHEEYENALLEAGIAIDTEGRIEDKANNILGFYDAKVHDPTSPTGIGIVDIKSVGDKKFKKVVSEGKPVYENQAQVNYYLWATGNTNSKGYLYYVNRDKPEDTFMTSFNFDRKMLEDNLNNLRQARENIYDALKKGKIGRGDLYDDVDKLRILADVAPYSEEYRRISATLARRNDLKTKEKEEISTIKQRVKEAKEPLRVYPYKFKTSNIKFENVRVEKIIDNNTLLVDRYGTKHSIKFAGIHVSESNSEKFDKEHTMDEAAKKELKKYIRKGKRITIGYDEDDLNKYSKDSTHSIRSVVMSGKSNVNKKLLEAGVAKKKEKDDSPAGIRARYSKGQIAFGSALEKTTHWIGNNVPVFGTKFLQVRSPYEQYKKREVYGKDFQSWNNPISDFLVPAINETISKKGFSGVVLGAFLGSMFGGSTYGGLVGAFVGGSIPVIGKIGSKFTTKQDRDWIPKKRRKQREVNEYLDTLKFVKNTKLYNEYKTKALKENNFDVDRFMGSKKSKGITNKLRRQELTSFKKKVKLDFKHRDDYNFKYGDPKYVDMKGDKKQIISQINKELAELQGERKVQRIPENALKAVAYKQAAEQTMYGYDRGESLQNLLVALPKKERQYFKYFVDAPEEEREKILRVVPEYTRRGLQMSWGMKPDEKPRLEEYFLKHGLPDENWIGWQEDTNMEDVKVKVVHQNNLDLGEFDIWQDQVQSANAAQIPIPVLNRNNKANTVKSRLRRILGGAGYEDLQIMHTNSIIGSKSRFDIYQDKREEVSNQINNMVI